MRPRARLRAITLLFATSFIVVTSCSAEDVEQAVGEGVDRAQEIASEASEGASEFVATAQFCKQAYDVADAIDDEDWDRAVDEGHELVAEAPDDIRPEAETVLAGAKRYVDGDRSAAADPEFQAAAQELRTYTEDNCDPR